MLNGQPLSGASYDASSQSLTLQFPNASQGAELRLTCGAQGQKPEVCFAVSVAPPPTPEE
jgi:hypothetical protein